MSYKRVAYLNAQNTVIASAGCLLSLFGKQTMNGSLFPSTHAAVQVNAINSRCLGLSYIVLNME